MLDQEDEGTRIGVWVALAVVFVVIVGLIGGLTLRKLHARAAAPTAMTAPAAAAVAGGPVDFVDAPLDGDVAGAVYFALGQSALPDGVEPVIAKLAAVAQDAADKRLVLSGFHDASGSADVNANIAKERAKSVRAALIAEGVDASRIVLRKPEVTLADGPPLEARRVEVRLVGAK
jgi:uncharacterized SAM-binding protein YcdF (DUF218 family)